MTNLARFTINGDPSASRGYDAEAASLTLALEASPSLVRSVRYSVAPTDGVRASRGAPTLTLNDGAGTTGADVFAVTPADTVTLSGLDLANPDTYEVRCIVDDGIDANGRPDPDRVFSRFVAVRKNGLRKVLPSERDEYDPEDLWAGALNDFVDGVAGVSAPGTGNASRLAYVGLDGLFAFAPTLASNGTFIGIGSGTLPSVGSLRFSNLGSIVSYTGSGNFTWASASGSALSLANAGLIISTISVNAAILPLRISEVWEYAPVDSPRVKSRTLYAKATLTGEDAEVITLATTGGTAYAVPSGFMARIILEIYARDTSTGDAYLSLTTITGKRESGGVFVARGTPDPDANLDSDVTVTNGCTASVAFTSSNIVVTVESSSGTVGWTVVATIQETVL